MRLLQILVLAVVQGATELLPVSSSAHVIVAEKLMGLDPTTPQMRSNTSVHFKNTQITYAHYV